MKFSLVQFSQRREQMVNLLLKLSEKMDVVDLPKREALVNTEGKQIPPILVWKVSKVFPVSQVHNAAVAFVIVFRNKFWKWWGYRFGSLCSKPEATVGQMVWDSAATGWMFFTGKHSKKSTWVRAPLFCLVQDTGWEGMEMSSWEHWEGEADFIVRVSVLD